MGIRTGRWVTAGIVVTTAWASTWRERAEKSAMQTRGESWFVTGAVAGRGEAVLQQSGLLTLAVGAQHSWEMFWAWVGVAHGSMRIARAINITAAMARRSMDSV